MVYKSFTWIFYWLLVIFYWLERIFTFFWESLIETTCKIKMNFYCFSWNWLNDITCGLGCNGAALLKYEIKANAKPRFYLRIMLMNHDHTVKYLKYLCMSVALMLIKSNTWAPGLLICVPFTFDLEIIRWNWVALDRFSSCPAPTWLTGALANRLHPWMLTCRCFTVQNTCGLGPQVQDDQNPAGYSVLPSGKRLSQRQVEASFPPGRTENLAGFWPWRTGFRHPWHRLFRKITFCPSHMIVTWSPHLDAWRLVT